MVEQGLNKVTAVLMAGGKGERFWPLSRIRRPKQFLALEEGKGSLLAEAARRVIPLVGWEGLFVVTGREYEALVREELPELPPEHLILEPQGRNTAPCLGLAALHLEQLFPGREIVMLALPADHTIADGESFRAVLRAAAEVAAQGPHLVTLGLRPTRPETGYGYIRLGPGMGSVGRYAVHRVAEFIEKPDPDTAERLLEEGRNLWNSGIFAWRVATLRSAIARYLPELHAALERVRQAWALSRAEAVLAEEYGRLEPISIDYGVLEPAGRRQKSALPGGKVKEIAEGEVEELLVLPADFGWDDVGSWPALARFLPLDPQGNAVRGEHVGLETRGCVIYSAGEKLVATLGISDLVVVETEDALLVCPRSRAQEIRALLKRIQEQGKGRYL